MDLLEGLNISFLILHAFLNRSLSFILTAVASSTLSSCFHFISSSSASSPSSWTSTLSSASSSSSDGIIINSHVLGEIVCNAKLSGVPDLTMTFENPGVMEDVSLHHCVRYFRWMHQKTVSFVPPDGVFTLLKYRSGFGPDKLYSSRILSFLSHLSKLLFL